MGLWFLYNIISSLYLKFPRAKYLYFSVSNQGFTHFKSLCKSLSSLQFRKFLPATSGFCQMKCYIHSYVTIWKPCELQLSFLPSVFACLWVFYVCTCCLLWRYSSPWLNEKNAVLFKWYLGDVKFASEKSSLNPWLR